MAKKKEKKPQDYLDDLISDTISDVNKAFKDDIKTDIATNVKYISNLEFLSTGNYAINYVCTGNPHKAFGKGRITSLVGESGGGKSLLLNHCLAETQKEDGVAILFDVERGNFDEHMTNLGLDLNKLVIVPEKTIEGMAEKTLFMIKKIREKDSEVPITIGWDSVTQATTRHEIEKGLDKVDMQRAKMIRAALRLVSKEISDSNIALIAIHHQTVNIAAGMYAASHEKKTIPGGTGVVYFSDQIIQVDKGPLVRDKDKLPIGITAKIQVLKSRYWIPFIKVRVDILFDRGFDQTSGLYDILFKEGIITNPKQGYYAFKDDPDNLVHGMPGVEKRIAQNIEKYVGMITREVKMAGEVFVDGDINDKDEGDK